MAFRRAAIRTLEKVRDKGRPIDLDLLAKLKETPQPVNPKVESYRLVVVGGGTAGLGIINSVSSYFGLDVCLIEPATTHHCQPLWTFVGGGKLSPTEIANYAARPTSEFLPEQITWEQTKAKSFDPENNIVVLENDKLIKYDQLVVAAGLQIDWGKIKGLPETIGKNGVCSNYSHLYAGTTWEFISSFKGGEALFTFPNTPVKCAGAPQKIMYLAHDHWEKNDVAASIKFVSGIGKLFSADKYCASLEKLCDSKGLDRNFGLNLVEVKGDTREAIFQVNKAIRKEDPEELYSYHYDFLHVTPPMSAPDFLKGSPIADAAGFVNVDKHTLQHVKYPNVFAIGDCSNLPTSKTATAIAGSMSVLTDNLINQSAGRKLTASYNGYTACPIPVGDNKLIMAEFDYDLKPCESTFLAQDKPSRLLYYATAKILPEVYWEQLLRGTWHGPKNSMMISRLAHFFKGSN